MTVYHNILRLIYSWFSIGLSPQATTVGFTDISGFDAE